MGGPEIKERGAEEEGPEGGGGGGRARRGRSRGEGVGMWKGFCQI